MTLSPEAALALAASLASKPTADRTRNGPAFTHEPLKEDAPEDPTSHRRVIQTEKAPIVVYLNISPAETSGQPETMTPSAGTNLVESPHPVIPGAVPPRQVEVLPLGVDAAAFLAGSKHSLDD
jgi:hypothetical protein